MWEINSAEQSLCFVYSICLGIGLGLIYDFFKIDRIVFKRRCLFIFFQDIIFWLISSFAFFSFSVVFSNGQIRAYLLFGCFLGFVFYKLTLSKIVMLFSVPYKKINNAAGNLYLNLLKKLNYSIICSINVVKNLAKKYLLTKKQKNI